MQVVPQQLSTRRILTQGCNLTIQTDIRIRKTANKYNNTSSICKTMLCVQNVNKIKWIGVSIFVVFYIVSMIELINTYNNQNKKLEIKKEWKEKSKLINQNDEPITREYYVRGFYIEDTSNRSTDEPEGYTKVEMEDNINEKLHEDNRDKEENIEENSIRKKFNIEQLESDLFSLIHKEFTQYRNFIKNEIYNEAKERTIGNAVDTDALTDIKQKLGSELEPDKLESIPIPSFTIRKRNLEPLSSDTVVKIDNSVLIQYIKFVEKYLTADEVLNLKSNTSSAKSFIDYLYSLKPKKDEEYTQDLYVFNDWVKDIYLAYERHVKVSLYEWHRTVAQERYDRIWRDYPTGALQPRDRDYIISNSDASEYNLTTDHIIQAATYDYYCCQLYFKKYRSVHNEILAKLWSGYLT